jgi:hypothetical protein
MPLLANTRGPATWLAHSYKIVLCFTATINLVISQRHIMGAAATTLAVGASTSDIARAYSPPGLYLPTMNHLVAGERIHLHSLPNGAQTAHFCSFATQTSHIRAAYRCDGAHSQKIQISLQLPAKLPAALAFTGQSVTTAGSPVVMPGRAGTR